LGWRRENELQIGEEKILRENKRGGHRQLPLLLVLLLTAH
jgi:hypothetical protein